MGLLLSHWAFEVLVRVTLGREPFFRDLRIDGDVFAFTMIVSFLTPFVFASLPVLRASRSNVCEDLKEGGLRSGAGGKGRHFYRALVSSEVGLAMVLLILTGVLVRSLHALTQIELGFDPSRMLTLRVDLPASRYGDEARILGFFEDLLKRARALPGVQSACLTSHRPILGDEPVGARIRLLGQVSSEWIEVVGVVGDLRNPDADQPPEPIVYRPLAQNATRNVALMARMDTDPIASADLVRRTVLDVDREQPVYDVRTMDQIVYDDVANNLALVGLMSYLTMVALGLALAGVYATISYAVSQRTHEIGIRMALGARSADVLDMVLCDGLSPVAMGIAIGIAAALAMSGALTHLVHGVSPTDPMTIVGVASALAVIACLATLGPALRAARIDPVDILRQE